MNFKEWLYNELSGSNAYNRMVKQHPGYKTMPKYVRGEFVNTSFGHSVNSSSVKDGLKNQSQIQPSEFLQNSPYKDRKWSKKPELLQSITPLSFEEKTLNIFVNRCFGYRPMPTIRNDLQRMNQQQKSLKINDNEPVIILQNPDGKLKLQEGWHRTMSILVWEGNNQYGAPDNDIKLLKEFADKLIKIDQTFINQFGVNALLSNNQVRVNWLTQTTSIANGLRKMLNFKNWQPINLKAFVGRTEQVVKPSQHDISTGDF